MKLNHLLHSNSEDFASLVKFEFKTHLRVKSNTRRNVLLIKVRVIPKVVHVVYVEENRGSIIRRDLRALESSF